MSVSAEIARAVRTGQPVRLHTRDGEVVVARVLSYDGQRVVYSAVTSSRPERYAVCDSTGFALPLEQIERAKLLVDKLRRKRSES